MKRSIFEPEHDMFRASFRAFVEREIAPFHEQWEHDGAVPRELWRKAGRQGFLGMDVPEEHGGAGERDYRYNMIIGEELARAGASGPGFALHSDVVVPYLLHYGSAEQQARWLPKMVAGECIGAIAMTEPGAGSDLAGVRTTAVRDGDGYILNGQKTFITNGMLADLVVVVAKTNPDKGHRGISLLVVERGAAGFERGRKLEKIGLRAQDTAELFFRDVRVPAADLLGEEGQGFSYLMQQLPQERLAIAVGSVAAAEAALDWTVAYCREREAFGQPIGRFQHIRFKLAELKTEIQIGRTFVDQCVLALNRGELSTETASMAKWWCSELQKRVVDECLQLHGGYGYMLEYPIARAYLDARVQTIYGGTTEIMKEIISRSFGF
ncbi:MAG TPA: acyl-CoA dehydrogenase family protein [Roseiflexaceae bacterium]|nr:acyl-CoA dehydrogenase family protein [Roseiflexaceae bacterium]